MVGALPVLSSHPQRKDGDIVCVTLRKMGAPKTVENEKTPDLNSPRCSYSVGDAFNADIILTKLGKYGWFQLKHLLWLGYGLLFPTASILIYTFVGATPAHRCFVEGCDDLDDPEYQATWLNETGSALNNLATNPRAWRCTYPDYEIIPETSTPSCATNYTANSTCDSWVFDDSVFTRTIVTDYDLVCDEAWKVTFGSFVTMLGVLVGAFFLGPLPDVVGRRKSTVFLSFWMSGFGIGSCFAPNFEAFASLRFLSAMGGVALMQALIIWGLEAMSPEMRIPFICIIYCFKTLGNLISGLLAYLIRDWTIIQLITMIAMATMVLCYFTLPESTRWLTVKKRYAEAKEIYEAAAKLNKKEIPPHLLVIPSDDPQKIADNDGVPSSGPTSHDSSPLASAILVLKTKCLLIRLLILCGTWLAQFLCYYGLSYASSNLSADIHFNFILVILVEIPAYVLGIFALEYLGRRLVMNFTLLGGGAFCLVAGLVSKEYGTVIVVFSLMGKFCTSMLTVANNASSFEVFPTVSRGITIGLCSTSGKIGSIISPYISALGATDPSLPYVIFGAISIAIGITTLWLPETTGLPAPSTIQEAIDLEKTKIDFGALFRKKRKICCASRST